MPAELLHPDEGQARTDDTWPDLPDLPRDLTDPERLRMSVTSAGAEAAWGTSAGTWPSFCGLKQDKVKVSFMSQVSISAEH